MSDERGSYWRTRIHAPIEERFWSKVARIDDATSCWLWTACVDPNGYGRFYVAPGRNRFAHRTAWVLSGRELADSDSLCHHCDTPACVRPDHMFVGSHGDNMLDMHLKGRASTKLTAATVAVILVRVAAGETSEALAAEFGVRRTCIDNIAKRHTWKHVAAPPGYDAQRGRWKCGAASPKAKLTLELVRALRDRYAAGGETYRSLAAQFGITHQATASIIKREHWQHV